MNRPSRPAPFVPRGRPAIAPPPPAARATAGVLSRFTKQFGSGLGALATHWSEIVGETTARLCTPVKLTGGKDGGTLHLAARGPGALLVEAESATILAQVNTYAGRPLARRIVITRTAARKAQEGAPTSKPAAAPAPRALAPTERLALEAELKDVADPKLRAALFKLGGAARASRPRR